MCSRFPQSPRSPLRYSLIHVSLSTCWLLQDEDNHEENNIRGRVDLVKESAAIVLVKDAREAPRLVLEGLDVHDFDEEQIAGLGAFDFEGTREVVDLGEIHIEHVVCGVVVTNLAAGPEMKLSCDNTVGRMEGFTSLRIQS